MKSMYLHSESSAEVQVKVPAERIDLAQWMFTMNDIDYRNCSPCHLGMGVSVLDDGRRTVVNTEYINGSVLIQHYVEDIAEPEHVRLISEDTQCYSAFSKVSVRVTWDMQIVPATASTSTLRCRIVTESPSKLVAFLGQHLSKKDIINHTREECDGFARDIERKFSAKSA